EAEHVWVLSHHLALGSVPGGTDVAGLGHLPEETEMLHDELLGGSSLGRQLQEDFDHRLGKLPCGETDVEACAANLCEVISHLSCSSSDNRAEAVTSRDWPSALPSALPGRRPA